MAAEYMEADILEPTNTISGTSNDVEHSMEAMEPDVNIISPVAMTSSKESSLWCPDDKHSSSAASGLSENSAHNDKKNEVFSFIKSTEKTDKPNSLNLSDGAPWEIRSPRPVKMPFACSSHAYLQRQTLQDNGIKQKFATKQQNAKNTFSESRRSLVFNTKSPSSAFTRNFPMQHQMSDSECDQRDSNLLKRCNSAPILNDVKVEEMHAPWTVQHVLPSRAGRMRRFSATVVSLNASPASGTRPNSRLRLHQLKKEESLEGIQNKETEHEREVQATIQISSNCGDMSLSDRRNSLDGYLGSSFSPRSRLSPSTLPLTKPCFSTPASTASKSCHSRAIDFNSQSVSHPVSSFSPTTPSYHALPPSGGIPSPLTFSASPNLFNSSPLPPSPTRSLCGGPGKQCFSPSMQVPVSLARASSRSPSPSPTRRAFVTRRRSQSPCIMRPSALGSIKRKCDSDNEGSSSPKRIFVPNLAKGFSGGAADQPTTTSSSLSVPHKVAVHRSHRCASDLYLSYHSLSSSSVDSSDLNVTPSPPYPSFNSFVSHQHIVPVALHPLHHSSIHAQGSSVSQTAEPHIRPSSPASSTCSSSSLEGLRDFQPLISPGQIAMNHLNKKMLKTSSDRPPVDNSPTS